MAHKKAAGSSKNLKDSNSKYRGVKLFGGQTAKAGNIIIRQKGDKYHLGDNVYKGRDFTIHAAIDGIVTFSKSNVTKYNGRVYLKTVVNVVPADQKPVVKAEKVVAKKTETAEKKVAAKKTEKVETTEKNVAAKKPAASKTTTEKKPAAKKTPKAQAPAKKKAE